MKLCTVDEIKDFLDIEYTNTDNDRILDLLCLWVSQMFEEYCSRDFDYGAKTEYYSGDGKSRLLQVKCPPIDTAQTITIYDDTDREYTSNDEIDSDDYFYDGDGSSGLIYLDGGTFGSGVNNIKITYTGGYQSTTLPADLKFAAVIQSTFFFQRRKQLGLQSISGAGGSINVETPLDLLRPAKQILAKYRIRAGIY